MITTTDGGKAFKAQLQEWIASARAMASDRELTDLYETSVTAFRASEFWADNIAAVPFKVIDPAGDPLPENSDHVLAQIFYHQNFNQLLRNIVITDLFWGRVLMKRVRNLYGRTARLTWINPNLYGLDAVNFDGLRGFYLYPGRYQIQHNEYLPLRDAVYFHRFDFNDDFDGISPAEVAFLQASTEPEIAMTVLSLFRNMAIPLAIVQPEDKATQQHATDKNFLEDFLRRAVQGARNFGRTFVSSTRWQWVQMQLPFKDMLVNDLKVSVREDTCIAFGVNVEFFVTGQTTYAELQGKIDLWRENVLRPRCIWYGEQFTEQLSGEFPGYRIEPDLSAILREDNAEKLAQVRGKQEAIIISLGTAQKEMGYEITPGFDKLYLVEGIPLPADELPNYWRYKMMLPVKTPPLMDGSTEDITIATEPTPLLPETAQTYLADDVFAEIKVAARKGSAFKPEALDQFTTLYIQTLHDAAYEQDVIINAAKAFALGVQAAKALQATRLDFENEFEDILAARMAGSLNNQRFSTLLRAIIRKYAIRAMRDGLADGGVNDEPDAEDYAELEDFLAQQSTYVSNFIATLKDTGISDAQAVGKPAMWFNKSIMPAYHIGLASAAANGVFEWVLGRTEEHCPDCRRLNGQRRRFKTWKAADLLPPTAKTNCGGWNCKCKLLPTRDPVSRGRLPMLVGKKHTHTHEADHGH